MRIRNVNKERDSRRGWLGWGLLSVAGLLAVLVALLAITLPLGRYGPVSLADQQPGGCNTGVNGFSLAVSASPTTAQPGDTITLQMRLENNNTSPPCDATSIDVEIGRNAAGDCQEDGGVFETVLINVNVPQNTTRTSSDTGFENLKQTCTIPSDEKGNFIIHTAASGELHTGTTHVPTGDHRDVLVIVVNSTPTPTSTATATATATATSTATATATSTATATAMSASISRRASRAFGGSI